MNSFGFGGSNTHVILDDAFHYLQDRGLTGHHCTAQVPGAVAEELVIHAHGYTNGQATGYMDGYTNGHTNETSPLNGSTTDLPKLLVWSAADKEALIRTIQGYSSFFEESVARSPTRTDQLAYTLAARRSQMLWRTFAVILPGTQKTLSPAKPIRSSTQARLAYVFTGQGAQYINMGWDLIQYPVFAQTLRQIDDIYAIFGCEWSIFSKAPRRRSAARPVVVPVTNTLLYRRASIQRKH